MKITDGIIVTTCDYYTESVEEPSAEYAGTVTPPSGKGIWWQRTLIISLHGWATGDTPPISAPEWAVTFPGADNPTEDNRTYYTTDKDTALEVAAVEGRCLWWRESSCHYTPWVKYKPGLSYATIGNNVVPISSSFNNLPNCGL